MQLAAPTLRAVRDLCQLRSELPYAVMSRTPIAKQAQLLPALRHRLT
jgi:hypothetical protein